MTRLEKFALKRNSIATQAHWDKIAATMPSDFNEQAPEFKSKVEIRAHRDVPDPAAQTAARLNQQAATIEGLRAELAIKSAETVAAKRQVEELQSVVTSRAK